MKTNEAPHSQNFDPETWIDQHGDYLFRYAMFRLRNRTAAEDAVQETLLAAVQAQRSFAGRSTERTWLTGILRHKIIDHLRANRRAFESLDADAESVLETRCFENAGAFAGHWRTNSAPVQWNLNAAEVMEQKEFWQTLDRCLGELPRRTAIAFTLKEIDGFSCEEICELLELSKNNLWVMLHRARLQLRQALEEEWFRAKPGERTRKSSARTALPVSAIASLDRTGSYVREVRF